MSFIAAATAIGFSGVGATIAAGAMMGGATTVAGNVIGGRDPFDNIGRGIITGGITGGIAPGVSEMTGLSIPASAGLITGGIETLATGSLSRGLMAGLGAYGAYGLAEGLGGGVSGSNVGAEQAFGDVPAVKGSTGDTFNKYLTGPDAGTKPFTDSRIGTGSFLKDNAKYLAAAATPIMAGAMVPTTTQAPTGKNENYIRQFDFNINPDTGKPDPLYGVRAMTPVKANEFGNKTFQGQRDLFRQQNPNPYELGVGSLNQPPQQQQTTPMATGGIVALAAGGDYRSLTKDSSAADIASAYKQAVTASGGDTAANQKVAIDYLTNLGIGQDKIGQAYGVYQASPTYTDYTQQNAADYLTANKDINIAEETARLNANPTMVNQYIASLANPFVGSTDTTGGSGTFGIYSDMVSKGIDPNEYYSALIASDPKYAGWTKEKIQTGYNLDKGALELSKSLEGTAADPKLGYDKQWVKFMDDNKYSIDDAAQAFGLSRNEVKARYDAVKNAEKKTTVVGGTGNDTIVGGTGNDVINNTFDSSTEVARQITNPYGNATNPGDLTYNTDGSTTVTPNIPYRPYGGFRGIQEIKDAYTKGGGSLGYTSKAPRTIDEFNQLYNKQTGDSLAAYDYLMGKGGGKYPSKSLASQMAVPYAEYALGKKTTGLKPITKTTGTSTGTFKAPQTYFDEKAYLAANPDVEAEMKAGKSNFASAYEHYLRYGKAEGRKFTGDYDSYTKAVAEADANTTAETPGFAMGGTSYSVGGGLGSLGSYSDGGRLLKGPGDGVSDSIPATIGAKNQPARLADGEFVIPARIVSELGNGSTDAGAKKLYAMMDRVQRARGKTTGKNKVAANSRSDKYLPA